MSDLLIAGANPNTTYDEHTPHGGGKTTPLHISARYGLKGVVSALLASGADKDALDYLGRSPLMEAAQNWGRSQQYVAAGTKDVRRELLISAEGDHLAVAVVDSLLAAGADVEIRNDDLQEVGGSVLVIAAEHGRIELLRAILRHGARVHDVDPTDEYESAGDSALHAAAKHGKAGAIGLLIEAGADVELVISAGLTLLVVPPKSTTTKPCAPSHSVEQTLTCKTAREI